MTLFRRWVIGCTITLFFLGLSAVVSAEAPRDDRFPIPFWYALEEQPARHLESMLAEFEATHKHIDVQPRNFSSSEELALALESGEKPVFAILETTQLERLAHSTELTAVEEWMPREQFLFSWSVKHDAYGPLFAHSCVGEQLMARPLFFTTSALIYELETLQKHNIASAPSTWAEMAKAVEKIRDAEEGRWGFGFESQKSLEQGLALMGQQSFFLLKEEGQEKFGATVLEMAQNLAKMVALPGDKGHVTMRIGTVQDYLELRREGYEVRTAGVPGPDAQSRRTHLKAWSLGMFPVESGDLYKAQELAFWLHSFEQQRHWAENTPYLAAHVKVFDNPFYRQSQAEDHNNLRVFVNLLGRADPIAFPAQHVHHQEAFLSLFPRLLRGEMNVQEALEAFSVLPPTSLLEEEPETNLPAPSL